MKKWIWVIISLVSIGTILIAVLAYQSPDIKMRVNWRMDVATTYIRSIFDPVKYAPTALPQPHLSLDRLTPIGTLSEATPHTTPNNTPAPLPARLILEAPEYEKEVYNNCGAATLAMILRMYGWVGNQNDIAEIIKPNIDDKNVNIDELVYFVRNRAGWLNAEYRVSGDIQLLKRLIANGFPVIVESGMRLDQSYRINDDRWGGHYLLVTGYDDDAGLFTTQDSWYSPNRLLTYAELDENWKAFNRAYLLVFLPNQTETLLALVGENWEEDTNRFNALNKAYDETEINPDDAYAWFNVGTNLLYFERNAESAQAYDTAIRLGIPQRMLRHQFGPFIAYFKTARNDDLKALAEYALKITPTSEENRLWYGWALFREGNKTAAIEEFNRALHINPNYLDARYALNYVGGNTQ
ncbi:MAG: C39 family peptidase [Anaerolineaceae bacterium]|nr:C39 family peptidase [Anaerolineaceae bacterium]MBN2677139.1 C39 family peptidase [Anaerolineaceae bacterium]